MEIKEKKIIIIVALLALLIFNTQAEVATFSEGCMSFGGSYLKLDNSKLNKYLTAISLDKLNNHLLLYGGEIKGKVNNRLMIGAYYYYGSQISGKIVNQITDEGNNLRLDRQFEQFLKMGGLLFEYSKNIQASSELFVGGSCGMGSYSFIISQDNGDVDFDDIWPSQDQNSDVFLYYRSNKYDSWMYNFEAFSGLRWYLTRGVALDLKIGYTWNIISSNGTLNYQFESIKSAPNFDFDDLKYTIVMSFGS